MTQSVSQDPLPSRNDGEGWLRTRSGERCLIRLSAADTNGVYSLVEIVSSPGDGTPLHDEADLPALAESFGVRLVGPAPF